MACVDSDVARIETLRSGNVPIYEPGLAELIQQNRLAGRLDFHVDIGAAIQNAGCIFIAVGTPMREDGTCDLSAVRSAARDIAQLLAHDAIVVNKSTVPVETGDLVAAIIREHSRKGVHVRFVCNPEFTREGSAIDDFMNPDRIVLGLSDESAAQAMRELYAPLDAPIVVTDVRTAEMIKCASNTFLAMKISFANEIAAICERVGADIADVVAITGADARIGSAFFQAGLGFGGSCRPKDVAALARVAEAYGVPSRLLPAVLAINEAQVALVADKLETALHGLHGKKIAVLGIAFKPETDDVRQSPAIALAVELPRARGFGNCARSRRNGKRSNASARSRCFCDRCVRSRPRCRDAIAVATGWPEYAQLDLAAVRDLVRGNIIVDARNALDAGRALALGFAYFGVGRTSAARFDSAQTLQANERA